MTETLGWEAWQRQTAAGAVESGQSVRVAAPVVPFDEHGACELGRIYWEVVERSFLGLVRRDRRSPLVVLRLLGAGPALLRFGEPELDVGPGAVTCRYPIAGGLLARRPQGAIAFAQAHDGDGVVLSSTIRDFFPTLAGRAAGPRWTGALYEHVQSRLHVAISRRYFARLAR